MFVFTCLKEKFHWAPYETKDRRSIEEDLNNFSILIHGFQKSLNPGKIHQFSSFTLSCLNCIQYCMKLFERGKFEVLELFLRET